MTVIDDNRFDIYTRYLNYIKNNLMSRNGLFRKSLEYRVLGLIVCAENAILLRLTNKYDPYDKFNMKTKADFFIKSFNVLSSYYKAYFRQGNEIEIKCYSRIKTNKYLNFKFYKIDEEIKHKERIETISILDINPTVIYNTLYIIFGKVINKKQNDFKCHLPILDLVLFFQK